MWSPPWRHAPVELSEFPCPAGEGITMPKTLESSRESLCNVAQQHCAVHPPAHTIKLAPTGVVSKWRTSALGYCLGDLLAGALMGAAVALVHRAIVPSHLGLAGEVVIGILVGLGVQMILCTIFGAGLGSMEVMVPGMFVCLLLALFPIFSPLSLRSESAFGAIVGGLVFLIFEIWAQVVRERQLQPDAPNKVPVPHSLTRSAPTAGWATPPWVYDLLEGAGSRRRARAQQQLYQQMTGRVLFVAAGTGLNFQNFPDQKDIVAVDINGEMLRYARARARKYSGNLTLVQADVQGLPFDDKSFDTIATASTFCSVPDPVRGLQELHRVLKPGGKLLMFEHVRSRNRLLGWELDTLNLVLRHTGPEVNRDTVANTHKAGFLIDRITCAYLDIFLAIEARKAV